MHICAKHEIKVRGTVKTNKNNIKSSLKCNRKIRSDIIIRHMKRALINTIINNLPSLQKNKDKNWPSNQQSVKKLATKTSYGTCVRLVGVLSAIECEIPQK